MLPVSTSEMFEAEKPEVTTRTLTGMMALVTLIWDHQKREMLAILE